MAKYLTNKETQAELEKLIKGAEKSLVLISPYIKLTNTLLARIKASAEKGVSVKIIFRKDKVDKEEFKKLSSIKNVEIKAIEDLHSKCYLNEKQLIITSLNLLETSEKNWEMGVLVTEKEDKSLFNDTKEECLAIYKSSVLQTAQTINDKISFLKSKGQNYSNYNSFIDDSDDDDYFEDDDEQECEECGRPIPYNPNKPLCYDCWKEENY